MDGAALPFSIWESMLRVMRSPTSCRWLSPASSLAWARMAEIARDEGRTIEAYAFARVGYHRGLDLLRRNGWKGHGPIPWSHEPNRGFLLCLYELSLASVAIGETEEAARTAQFLRDSSADKPSATAKADPKAKWSTLFSVYASTTAQARACLWPRPSAP